MKNENYITILGWMTNLGLNPNELLVFALIYGFTQDQKSKYTGSSSYISEILNISPNTSRSILKKLCEKDFLILEKTTNNNVTFNTYSISGRVYQILVMGIPKFGNGGIPNFGSNINTLNNTNKSNIVIEFEKTFLEYENMRKKIKKPMTEKAKELIKKDLRKFCGNDIKKAIEVLNQSIKNSWQGVFDLKPDESSKPKNTSRAL
jgi:hypothetical protein